MSSWAIFWTGFLVLAVVSFAALAAVVSVGAFFDAKALFRKLDARRSDDDSEDPNGHVD